MKNLKFPYCRSKNILLFKLYLVWGNYFNFKLFISLFFIKYFLSKSFDIPIIFFLKTFVNFEPSKMS